MTFKMIFRINPSLLRLCNTGKERSMPIINSRYINATVSHIGSIKSVKRSIIIIQERSHRSVGAFSYVKNFQCHPKGILRRNLFLKLLMQLMTKKVTKEEQEEDWGGPEAFKLITFIKDDFDDVLKKNSFVLVFFSANWCPHCMRLRKPYGMAALMSKEANLPMKFATFDVNYNPDVADEKGVVGIPLIKYYKDGQFVTNYKGKRTTEDLFNFAKNPPERVKDTKKPDI